MEIDGVETGFKHLQNIYLTGYLLAGGNSYIYTSFPLKKVNLAANSLQLSYRYAIYDSYGYPRATVEFFYIVAHMSTLFIGTFLASLADRFGRRLSCIFCGILYILSGVSYNFNVISILIMGNIIRGVANSFFHTEFEAWVIQEYKNRNLNLQSLPQLLRNSNIFGTIISIGMGFFAQVLVEFFGFIAPFDTSIVIFTLMIVYMLFEWSENYGNPTVSANVSFISAIQLIKFDSRIVLHGLSTALFETSLYIYFIEWTPALLKAKSLTISDPLPFGVIFACYKFSNMMGSFAFEAIVKKIRPQLLIIIIAIILITGFSSAVIWSNVQVVILIGFLFVEFGSGAYRPSIGLLRSQYIPNEVRSTIMNYIRVPQLILIIFILLCHFPLPILFSIAAGMILLAIICLIILKDMKPPSKKMDGNQEIVLLTSLPFLSYVHEKPQISQKE
ncbi:unnamed protein product [Adineta ricciae]|uniref:Uncharacterized protein n=1 Tax=Adineta ricciae TaxID=249248 RepID=A0A815Q0W0_ADIRI|nr:unnamed protein product [Adineta ricciae]